MPRKPLITQKEYTNIAIVFGQYPNAKAEFIRQQASKLSGRELGKSTVERELARLRKDHPEGLFQPDDNQWSLASLDILPIDKGAIPLLLYVKKTFEFNLLEETKQKRAAEGRHLPCLSNRLAKWIARLMAVPVATEGDTIEPPLLLPKNPNPDKWPQVLFNLVNTAMWYASYERGCQLSNKESTNGTRLINTSYFDAPSLHGIIDNINYYTKEIPPNADLPHMVEFIQKKGTPKRGLK